MDFSFMKTGRSNTSTSTNNTQDMLNILELFTSNALKTSSRFVGLCGRNGITSVDIKYGLIYEVFEFFARQNNLHDLKEIECLNKEDEEEEDIEDYIIEDSELDEFGRIEIENIKDSEDKEFVEKLYRYYDNWGAWEPKTVTEQILHSAINKIMV